MELVGICVALYLSLCFALIFYGLIVRIEKLEARLDSLVAELTRNAEAETDALRGGGA